MRILVLTYEFPPLGGGGGQAALDICQGLVKRGHEVHVLTAYMKGLPRRETVQGIYTLRIPSARRLPYKAGLTTLFAYTISSFPVGLCHILSWRPDVIHVHFAVPSGPSAWLLSRLTDIPFVLTAHLGDVPGGVPEKTDKWFRWISPFTPPIWRDAAQVVAVSEFTRQLAQNHYPVDISVIPNGVDLSCLDPGEIQVNSPPRIIFAGRFMPQKNPIQLVRTLGTLKHLEWNCVMLGDGPLQSEIVRAVQDFDLKGRFEFPGWVSPQEVVEWLSRSDLLFMPSLTEGLPVVGVQSLAMGLSIVASRIGGFIDLVDNGVNGYLIDPKNTEGYAQALTELLTNTKQLHSFRQASRQKAQHFDIKKIVDDYENIFLEILKR